MPVVWMCAAMAIELVIMEESMKRSHWHRLKSTSRWVFGFERVRLRTISQPKTLGLGAEMPMEQDEAQCNGLRLSGAQDTIITVTKNRQRLCALSICLSLSHAFSVWPQMLVEYTHARQPRTSVVISWPKKPLPPLLLHFHPLAPLNRCLFLLLSSATFLIISLFAGPCGCWFLFNTVHFCLLLSATASHLSYSPFFSLSILDKAASSTLTACMTRAV